LKDLLPSDGAIHFVRFNNYAGYSFHLSRHRDFDRFLDACEFPEFEFIDPDLEGLRADLKEHTTEFVGLIGQNTWRLREDTEGRSSVPPEWADDEPERFDHVVNQIHGATTRICDTYDSLVRLARRRLAIE
jgi:hypothetical protein